MADAPRRFTDRPLVRLVLVRILEFVREPEAIFWTFLFPVLMTAGLGIAFRSRPEDPSKVAIQADAPAASEAMARLTGNPLLEPALMGDSAAARALRTGKVALVVKIGRAHV